MRLIDADKIYPDCMTKNGTLAISQSQIANAPTVDAIPNKEGYEMFNKGYVSGYERSKEERPHGEWNCTFHSSFPQYEQDEYRCSICNGRGGKLDKFCKHCGAEMGKKVENE